MQFRKLKGPKNYNGSDRPKGKKEKQKPSELTGTIGLKNTNRNKLCPCGSGRKNKNCCIGAASQIQQKAQQVVDWSCPYCERDNSITVNNQKREELECSTCGETSAVYVRIENGRWQASAVRLQA